MNIGPLYHWSPATNRESILRDGLKVYSAPVVHSSGSFPYLCFGPSPRGAWSLSGKMEWVQEVEQWDLWEIQVSPYDEVRVLPFQGQSAEEIRFYNSVPPNRCWLVATRSELCAIGVSTYDYFPELRPNDATIHPSKEESSLRQEIPVQVPQQADSSSRHPYGARSGIL